MAPATCPKGFGKDSAGYHTVVSDKYDFATGFQLELTKNKTSWAERLFWYHAICQISQRPKSKLTKMASTRQSGILFIQTLHPLLERQCSLDASGTQRNRLIDHFTYMLRFCQLPKFQVITYATNDLPLIDHFWMANPKHWRDRDTESSARQLKVVTRGQAMHSTNNVAKRF